LNNNKIRNQAAQSGLSFFKYVLLPLILGYILYQFRPSGNGWIDKFSISNGRWNDLVDLPQFCLYNLVDGLWSFALASFILIIWSNNHVSSRRLWLGIGFCFVIGIELAQNLGLMAGTFDWLDLLINAAGFLTSILIFNHYEKSNT